MPRTGEEFAGFSLPNATPTPEELIRLLPGLSGAEVKVLLWLFYKTLGFRKREDAVSLSQIVEGTGLSRPAAVKAVRQLEERGCVEVVRGVTREGDRETNVYRPRFRDGEGVVKKVNHPLKESFRGVVKKVNQVVNEVNQHDISAAATAAEGDSDFLRFFKEHFGREPAVEEIAEIRALEAEGIPAEVIQEGIADAFRSRRRSDRPLTLKDCIRVIRRRHRKHHPEDAETLPANSCRKAAALAAGEAAASPSPAAISTPRAPVPQEAPNGLCPAAADPLSGTDDPLQEVWLALAECGYDTLPVRRGLRLVAEGHPPERVYRAVVEALAYGVPAQRLVGYVRAMLKRLAEEEPGPGPPEASPEAMAGEEVGPSEVGPPESAPGPVQSSDGVWGKVLQQLQLELTRATFTTWLAGSRCVGWEGDVLVVEVASRYAREWLETRLRGVVERALVQVVGSPVNVRFVVAGEVNGG